MKDRDIKGIFSIGYECDSIEHEADHHAKMLPSTAWLMTILQAKTIMVGIDASCSCRGPDLEPSITAEISYYTHKTVITQNRRWKYLLRSTISKIAIRHHHQKLLLRADFPEVAASHSKSTENHTDACWLSLWPWGPEGTNILTT